MKIILIRPPARYFKGAPRPSLGLPLGLLYIAAVLEKNGFTVEIYDAQANPDVPISHEPDGNLLMGDSWQTIEKRISDTNPGLVGITNPFTTQLDTAIRVAQIVKKINPGVVVAVGGNHPTVRPEDFLLGTDAVDIACIGEGEYTMLDIAAALRDQKSWRDIPGTAVSNDGRIRINRARGYIQDLDALPLPAYHLIDVERYFALSKKGIGGRPVWDYAGSERAVSVITSRGCPFNCVFCSIHLHMGTQWRAHTPDSVLRHLEFLCATYGVRHVHFEDDNLTFDIDRFKAILRGFSKNGIHITWDTPNGIRADKITKELLKESEQKGCIYIILGVESGSQRVLREVIGKNLDLHKVVKVAEWCKEIGLDAFAFFIIGFPGEKVEEMKKTVDLALHLMHTYDLAPSLFNATPLWGTRLYAQAFEKGYLRKELSSENLALATEGGAEESLIKTEEFGPPEIRILRQRFIRGFKIIFVKNIVLFLLKNPRIFGEFIRRVMRLKKQSGYKQAILELADLKNCLLREIPQGGAL